MVKKIYVVPDTNEGSVVYETRRQKDILDILDILDEILENADQFGWNYVFEDKSFYIEYIKGTIYEANENGECGVYKKKGIRRIIYTSANDTQVFGDYTVNEYGNVG